MATSTPGSEAEVMEAARRQALARAGLVGTKAGADSPEGREAFARVEKGVGTYLFGLPGRGKTWAAACAVRLAVEAWYDPCDPSTHSPAWLVTASTLLDSVRRGYDDGDGWALSKARRVRLLVIDDLGAESPTGWAREQLTSLIDHRISREVPTVVTSNLRIGQVRDRWGDDGARLASRLAGHCVPVEMAGPDRRLAWRG